MSVFVREVVLQRCNIKSDFEYHLLASDLLLEILFALFL
jgi:hypothetical protein